MITLVPPDFAPPPAWLDAPGGFLWWYVDLRDDRGQGAVLIWSFGLPFLPGVVSADRDGRPLAPRQRPSLNVVLYRDGVPDFYLLRTFAPNEASWTPEDDTGTESWTFGETVLTRRRTSPGHRRVEIALDVDVPVSRERLQGTLVIEGPEARYAKDSPVHAPQTREAAARSHHWSPLIPAGRGIGTLRRTLDGAQAAPPLTLDADAYHDRNASPVGLHRLGIDHWIWGRARVGEGTRVHYLVYPEDPDAAPILLGLDLAPDGHVRLADGLEAPLGAGRRTFYGMRWWPEVEIRQHGAPWLTVRHRERVDDGFFYLRFGTEVVAGDGTRGEGWGELVRPARIDLLRHRPLVRMAVHEGAGGNSLWLPLFSGPREGRVRRLLLRR
ncbi:MAG: hypothetical protein EA398_18280 [Deltaproteobacteria bacterium]|nr:MAG: hypothetical protein EA398_18280 [Deltaproteobacteria bacterium]